MSVREDIKNKAFACLDETEINADAINISAYPLDTFLDEAGERVLRIAPLHTLGAGLPLPTESFTPHSDGSGSVNLPADFLRLICFRLRGWLHGKPIVIYDTNSLYAQQMNPVLRGGVAKPVVAICENRNILEYFSSPDGENAEIIEARYFGYTNVDDNYPVLLHNALAWSLAGIVASIMGDVQTMQLCEAKVQEQITLLQ